MQMLVGINIRMYWIVKSPLCYVRYWPGKYYLKWEKPISKYNFARTQSVFNLRKGDALTKVLLNSNTI